jgi:hypothetical protein
MMSLNSDKPVKKDYQKPVLRVYGDIQAMTQTAGNGSVLDGPMANKSR